MKERLQKLLSAAGACSRRRAEEYIAAGRVSVNGKIAVIGDKAELGTDVICLDGKPLAREKTLWLMLNKPRGYVTTLSDEKGRKTAAQLVSGCGGRVWPVGRLDMDSEGLLLFTNDGEGTFQLSHPSHEVEKEYRVTVEGEVDHGLGVLSAPVLLDGKTVTAERVAVVKRYEHGAELSIVIRQGLNRQIRRMCEAAGLRVTRLIRVREGSLILGGLPKGKWRYLTQEEQAALLSR